MDEWMQTDPESTHTSAPTHALYAYALLCPMAGLVLPAGLSGDLSLVGTGAVQALVEPELNLETWQTDDDRMMQAVLHHDQVIRAMFDQVDVLPLRFGTGFRSPQSLSDRLQVNEADYLAALSVLAGKAEYMVRFSPVEVMAPAVSTQTAGKDYFLAKKRQYQMQVEQQQQQQAEWEAIQGAIAQLYPHQSAPPRDETQRIYILGDRPVTPTLEHHFTRWQKLCPHWLLTLEGGFPPYHFV
jgi:hypothetical protein